MNSLFAIKCLVKANLLELSDHWNTVGPNLRLEIGSLTVDPRGNHKFAGIGGNIVRL